MLVKIDICPKQLPFNDDLYLKIVYNNPLNRIYGPYARGKAHTGTDRNGLSPWWQEVLCFTVDGSAPDPQNKR